MRWTWLCVLILGSLTLCARSSPISIEFQSQRSAGQFEGKESVPLSSSSPSFASRHTDRYKRALRPSIVQEVVEKEVKMTAKMKALLAVGVVGLVGTVGWNYIALTSFLANRRNFLDKKKMLEEQKKRPKPQPGDVYCTIETYLTADQVATQTPSKVTLPCYQLSNWNKGMSTDGQGLAAATAPAPAASYPNTPQPPASMGEPATASALQGRSIDSPAPNPASSNANAGSSAGSETGSLDRRLNSENQGRTRSSQVGSISTPAQSGSEPESASIPASYQQPGFVRIRRRKRGLTGWQPLRPFLAFLKAESTKTGSAAMRSSQEEVQSLTRGMEMLPSPSNRQNLQSSSSASLKGGITDRGGMSGIHLSDEDNVPGMRNRRLASNELLDNAPSLSDSRLWGRLALSRSDLKGKRPIMPGHPSPKPQVMPLPTVQEIQLPRLQAHSGHDAASSSSSSFSSADRDEIRPVPEEPEHLPSSPRQPTPASSGQNIKPPKTYEQKVKEQEEKFANTTFGLTILNTIGNIPSLILTTLNAYLYKGNPKVD